MPGLADTEIGLLEASIRLIVALAAGGLIGFDRERKDKEAGLRTCMLVALAASLLTIVTGEISEGWSETQRVVPDPVRLVEAITSGVAFIAAGAIISKGNTVAGLTTGAAIWLAGALGMASGAGYYALVAVACGLGLFVLLPVDILQDKLFEKIGKKSDSS